MIGTAGDDRLLGSSDDELMRGRAGVDVLRGRSGDDRLDGGSDGDVLVGGVGNDVFVFGAPQKTADVIRAGDGARAFEGAGLVAGDRIDLGGIDADATRAGQQAFGFDGTGKGQVAVLETEGGSLVVANTDDDLAFEFALLIEDGAVRASAYAAADFIL